MGETKRAMQYVGALGATMGGFALGTVIGWSSPASAPLKKLKISDDDVSWISSIMAIGAAAAQIYTALTLDLFGRKLGMLIICIPFIIGWLVLIIAKSVWMYCLGRFITGFCGGTLCVISPLYIGETVDKEVRGALGTGFQLLLVNGILLAYGLGYSENLNILTVPLLAGPIILFMIIIFMPETPVMLFKKGKADKAAAAIKFFKGADYNPAADLAEIEKYTKADVGGFWAQFKTKASIKAFLILLALNLFQQLSGINSIMFYAAEIFSMAGSSMSAHTCSVILGVVQVCCTFISALSVDRAGRRLFWTISFSIMGVCLCLMGVFFMVKKNDEDQAKGMTWLPLLATCLYIAGFSLGAGPLPWVMLGELLPNGVKGILGPFAVFLNWMLAFTVTKTFSAMVKGMGAHMVFWGYAIVCALAVIFSMLFLVETKAKTLEQIQEELGQ